MSNLPPKTHLLILMLVVLIELISGSIFLYKYYQQIKYRKEQEQLKKITFIDKKNLVFPDIDGFKYYWELKPNITITDQPDWLDHKATYTHNADGLNERFNYEVEKPSNTFRIITLGDSFTYGANVNTADNWTEKLEDMLNNDQTINDLKFEVINLGVSGFDIPYLIKRYQDIGAKYQPDLIIWFESGSGFIRINEIEQPFTENCLKQYQQNNKSISEEAIHPCYTETDQYIINKFSNNLEQLNTELINKLNIFLETLEQDKIVFFSFSKRTIYSPKFLEPTIEKINSKHKNVRYLSIIDEKDITKTRLQDGHPNKEGHQIIAKTIYQYLKDNLLN